MKHRGEGFQKRTKPENSKSVGMALISYEPDGSVRCSCGGWSYRHARDKVREDAIDRHLTRKHGGRGFRL